MQCNTFCNMSFFYHPSELPDANQLASAALRARQGAHSSGLQLVWVLLPAGSGLQFTGMLRASSHRSGWYLALACFALSPLASRTYNISGALLFSVLQAAPASCNCVHASSYSVPSSPDASTRFPRFKSWTALFFLLFQRPFPVAHVQDTPNIRFLVLVLQLSSFSRVLLSHPPFSLGVLASDFSVIVSFSSSADTFMKLKLKCKLKYSSLDTASNYPSCLHIALPLFRSCARS